MRLREVVGELAEIVAALEPDTYSGSDAAQLASLFEQAERLSAAGKALAARRAADCGEWSRQGARSAEQWLAGLWGTEQSSAQATLDTARAAGTDPRLDEALRTGEVSAAQAGHIARATAGDPEATERLVHSAKTRSLKGFMADCRQVANRASSAEDDQERARRLRQGRYLRTWSEQDGSGRIDGRFDPLSFAELKACLVPFETQAFDAARAEGRRETFDAYRADALVDMARAATSALVPPGHTAPATTTPADQTNPATTTPADEPAGRPSFANSPPPSENPRSAQTGTRRGRRLRVEVIAVIDIAALARGYTQGEERCYIEGVGPVPVSVVKDMAANACLAAVLTNGVDIRSVVHLGRHPTRLQKTALRVRDPHCVVPGCDVTENLQVDHCPEWEKTRHTTLDELARECAFHHRQRTYDGAALGGTPGDWKWIPPLPGPFDDPLEQVPTDHTDMEAAVPPAAPGAAPGQSVPSSSSPSTLDREG